MLGGRGQGHLLGQYRLGPARLAHCMRWIGQAETALDMMVDRSLERFSHGSLLAEKQGIQWMIADSTMELYQAKLMVLHAAYKIDAGRLQERGLDGQALRGQHALNRIIDRAIQVHGALGYSTDTPLAHMYQQARWARFADGADEIHQMRIASARSRPGPGRGASKRRPAICPSRDPASSPIAGAPAAQEEPGRRVCYRAARLSAYQFPPV
jgi:acyl-CoA dehydrogenase